MVDEDPLNMLEGLTNAGDDAGETPPVPDSDSDSDIGQQVQQSTPVPESAPALQKPRADISGADPAVVQGIAQDIVEKRLPEDYRLVVKPARVPDDVASLKSGYELVSGILPVEQHKALGQWVMRYRVTENDPTWGDYLAGNVAFNSAAAAQKSAEIIIQGVERIPKIVQDAFVYAERDVRADLMKIFAVSGGQFTSSIQKLITDSADAGAEKLRGAASVLDSELTRKIEIRKTEGIDLWVAKAVEAADVALAKQKIVSFYFLSFGIVGLLLTGGVIGAVLEAHF